MEIANITANPARRAEVNFPDGRKLAVNLPKTSRNGEFLVWGSRRGPTAQMISLPPEWVDKVADVFKVDASELGRLVRTLTQQQSFFLKSGTDRKALQKECDEANLVESGRITKIYFTVSRRIPSISDPH